MNELRHVFEHFKKARDALLNECMASEESVACSARNERMKLSNPDEYNRRIETAREECRIAGLDYAHYGPLLTDASKWYLAYSLVDPRAGFDRIAKLLAIPKHPRIFEILEQLEALVEEVESRQRRAAPAASAITRLMDALAAPEKPHCKGKRRVSKLATALGILADHPEWQDKEIAETAECTPEYLSRNKKWQAARAAIRETGKRDMTRSKRHRGIDPVEYE